MLGQKRLNQRTRTNLEKGREYFAQAIALDPNYTRALAALAFTHILLSNSPGCYGTTPLDKTLALAKPFLDRAVAIDPSSSDLNRVLSFYHERLGNHREAIRTAEKALSENANSSEAVVALGIAVAANGDPAADNVQTLLRAVELDPLTTVTRINLVLCLTQRQRQDEAQTVLATPRAIDAPDSVIAFATLYKADVFLRDPNLSSLQNEPRYIELRARIDAHFETERAAAEKAGLLPIPQDVLAAIQMNES